MLGSEKEAGGQIKRLASRAWRTCIGIGAGGTERVESYLKATGAGDGGHELVLRQEVGPAAHVEPDVFQTPAREFRVNSGSTSRPCVAMVGCQGGGLGVLTPDALDRPRNIQIAPPPRGGCDGPTVTAWRRGSRLQGDIKNASTVSRFACDALRRPRGTSSSPATAPSRVGLPHVPSAVIVQGAGGVSLAPLYHRQLHPNLANVRRALCLRTAGS